MVRFTRIGAPQVLIQAHVTDDSRYVLLPVTEEATKILGWVVYDTVAGQIVQPNPTPLNDGREWVSNYMNKE